LTWRHAVTEQGVVVVLGVTYLAFVALDFDRPLGLWLLAAAVGAYLFPLTGIALTAVTMVPPEAELVTGLPTGFFLLIAAGLGQLTRAAIQGRKLRVSWPVAAAAGFGLITLTNLLWVLARDVEAPRAIADWAILMTGILAYIVVASEPRAARRAPIFVFGTGVAISMIAAASIVIPGPFQEGLLGWLVREGTTGRATGSTHGANILGVVAGLAFTYFTVRAAGRERGRSVAIALVMAGLCLPALYFTFSRSAALGVGIAVVLGLLLLGRRAATIVGIALVASAIILGPILIANRLDASSGSVGGSQDPRVTEAQATSDRLRLQAWIAGVRMAIDQPITGVGMGRYPILRERYGGPSQLNSTHSDYIRFFAETGLPGGVAFLLFLGGIAWSLKGPRDGHRAGLAAAVAAFCIATQFNAQLYYLEASLPFWVAAGAAFHLPSSGTPNRADAVPRLEGHAWSRSQAHPSGRVSREVG
jgi:O-antigen ligase